MKKKMAKKAVAVLLLAMFLFACGTTTQTVREDALTRAEFVAEVTNFFGWPHREDYNDYWEDLTPAKTFNDVQKSDQYGKQIEAAYEEGIITADSAGNFRPGDAITREEAAVILAAAWQLPGPDDVPGLLTGDAQAAPGDPLAKEDFETVFSTMKETMVAPVYALPRQGFDSPRRYVYLYCATPGATIYYTKDGSEPTESSYVYAPEYTKEGTGHIMEMLGSRGGAEGPPPTDRDVVYKAYSVKDNMEASDTRTFTWHLFRPSSDDAGFESVKVVEGSGNVPTVYEIYNNSESVRAMAWYVEGPDSGFVYDALQTPVAVANMKDYIDTIATKPYICILGHEHGDHDAQLPAFINAGIETYANDRGWGAMGVPGGFGAVLTTRDLQEKVKNVDEGDSFDLGGGIVFTVFAMPGHANGNIVLSDTKSGMVFASDIYGCTRAGSADNVGVAGLPVDLLLAFSQQAHSFYRRGGADVSMLFTGHDEYPLKEVNLDLFEAALQQVIDKGEAGCSPTYRTNNKPNSRTTTIGDMWTDGTEWIALSIGGTLGDDYEYLTSNDYMNYNGADGFMKYSVLSNLEIEGGDLIGTTITWADSKTFEWNGETITVPNSVSDRFDPWTFDYTIEVEYGTTSISLCPVTMSTKVSSIRLNGKNVDYGSDNTVKVSNGSVITIDVVAPDGETSSSYTFTISEV